MGFLILPAWCPGEGLGQLKHSSGFGKPATATSPRWLSKGISQLPRLLRTAPIQKEAALSRTIPILFPLYFYDCHVDRGKGEAGGERQIREKEKQDVKFCL